MIFFDKPGFVLSSLRRSPCVNHPLTITTYLCSSDQFKYSSIVHMSDLLLLTLPNVHPLHVLNVHVCVNYFTCIVLMCLY